MTIKQQTVNKKFPSTLAELIIDMELNPDKYKHLQFILNQHKNYSINFGQMYMVVNQVGFGLYRLDNVDYKEGVILLSFTNPATGNKAEFSVDINNKHPQVFLVNWSDIEDMVYSDVTSNYNDKELRELENELP